MQRTLLLLLFGLLVSLPNYTAWGQINKCEGRLYFSSKELREPTKDTVFITHVNFIWFGAKTFKVKLKDKSKKRYFFNGIWGIQVHNKLLGKCKILRSYDNDFYVLEGMQEKDGVGLIIYSQSKGGRRGGKYYYFSTTLDKPIYPLNRDYLITEFKHNRCFIEKLNNMKWYQSYNAFNDMDGTKAIEFYNECK